MWIICKKKFSFKRPKGKKDNKPPWIELPRDVLENILRRLHPVEILQSAQYVCATWWILCSEPSLWRVIDMKYSGVDHRLLECPNIMCFHAIDRSQGELIDINIEHFGINRLLRHLSQRSSRLKRLRLEDCYDISGGVLTESVKNFPELEELHLIHMPFITAAHIEAISISCPELKSFTLTNRRYRFVRTDDSYAMTISKNMPNIHHLCLIGNRMSNEGLKAILDGCPNLESLDLRKCFHVNLGGDLGRICSAQIINLKHPSDSTDDYEWDDKNCVIFDF